MKGKYHISLKGSPAPCKAKMFCPRGGISEHFSSPKEALIYADKRNEMKVQAEDILSIYYSGNMSTEELGLNNNSYCKIEAYNNGYEGNIEQEDYIVQKGVLENGLMIDKLIYSKDPYISSKALETYYKNKGKKLNLKNIDSLISSELDKLKKDGKNEQLRTEVALLSQYKEIMKGNTSTIETRDVLKTVNQPDGGATFNPLNNKTPSSGFCYSPYPEVSKTVKFSEDLAENKNILLNYLKENKELLEKENHYIGLWNDPETGIIYMDVSVHSMNAKEVRIGCKEKDQIAYFDLQTFESVTVNQNATSGQNIDTDIKNFKELETDGVFSEELSKKIHNTQDDELEKMYKYFKENPDIDKIDEI